MQPDLYEPEEPVLLMPGVFVAAAAFAAWVGRKGPAYFRPFGPAEAESLMNCSRLGALHCTCVPTDASAPQNDRRQSCRACGHVIVGYDPAQLYAKLSVRQIDRLAETMRRRAIDEARHASPIPVGDFAETYAQEHLH